MRIKNIAMTYKPVLVQKNAAPKFGTITPEAQRKMHEIADNAPGLHRGDKEDIKMYADRALPENDEVHMYLKNGKLAVEFYKDKAKYEQRCKKSQVDLNDLNNPENLDALGVIIFNASRGWEPPETPIVEEYRPIFSADTIYTF